MYYIYHRDKGHTTEQCRVLKDHLGQLVKARYLKEFVVDSRNQGADQGALQKGNLFPPPLGVIEVIYAASRGSTITRKGVLTVAPMEDCSGKQLLEKKIRIGWESIAFGNEDLEGTIQPHDDVLVVTVQISGFLVKRVMVDQGSGANIMYPDLFKGLGLKSQDLIKYDTPLVSFYRRVVIHEGQISLPMNMEGKEMMVTFIEVSSFSLYTAILGRLWIHTMEAVPSTLHVKVQFRTEQGVAVVRGSQKVAWQCLVAAVSWKDKQDKQKQTTEEASL